MKIKRFAACILALAMLFSCTATAWAEGVGMYVTIPYLDDSVRYDLMYFIGSTFDALDRETTDLSLKSSSSSEIKWGNSTVSVTGTGSGTITRIRLDSGNSTYCTAGVCPDLGTSDFQYVINNKGFTFYKSVNKNGTDWQIFKNSSTKRFCAYSMTYGMVDTVYYGMEGYMPFG